MAGSRVTVDRITLKYRGLPDELPHTQFDPEQADVHKLQDFVRSSTTSLNLHIGTNDLTNSTPTEVMKTYRRLLDAIGRDHPSIRSVFVTLVLPCHINLHRRRLDWNFVRAFNRRASEFNALPSKHRHYT